MFLLLLCTSVIGVQAFASCYSTILPALPLKHFANGIKICMIVEWTPACLFSHFLIGVSFL